MRARNGSTLNAEIKKEKREDHTVLGECDTPVFKLGVGDYHQKMTNTDDDQMQGSQHSDNAEEELRRVFKKASFREMKVSHSTSSDLLFLNLSLAGDWAIQLGLYHRQIRQRCIHY